MAILVDFFLRFSSSNVIESFIKALVLKEPGFVRPYSVIPAKAEPAPDSIILP